MGKSISLVLGSGGARGYAHIGVIEELLEHGYEIKSISGSSMGAMIGALYACGKLAAFKDWVLSLDLIDTVRLLDFSLAKNGLIQGDKVFSVLEEMIGEITIEELPIAYTAVATDIIRQKEVWIQKGKLLDAVRASVAIPTILTPKKMGDQYLIDGGVLNPIPIAPTMSDNTDLTIAVSLDAMVAKEYKIDIPQVEQDKENGMQKVFFDLTQKAENMFSKESESTFENMGISDIIGHTIDTMQNALSAYKIAGYSPDITIGIPHDACGFYEFNRAYELIELGKVITKEQLNEIAYNT